jgi:hypothetical protein
MNPFRYPEFPHIRRHGPRGYAEYASFRPWLRDEFSFRCVYCLVREQWGRTTGAFNLDHFLPASHYPEHSGTYENLYYCCTRCNGIKTDAHIPDPGQIFVHSNVEVLPDGKLEVRAADARLLVIWLRLNDEKSIEFRRMWLRIIAMAEVHDPALYRQLMSFPTDLPNLEQLRPPEGNGRPAGIGASY